MLRGLQLFRELLAFRGGGIGQKLRLVISRKDHDVAARAPRVGAHGNKQMSTSRARGPLSIMSPVVTSTACPARHRAFRV